MDPSKPNNYTGPLAQTKFRILGGISSSVPPRTTTQTTLGSNVTSRIASRPSGLVKPSGLIKPTPVRHIISAATTTTSSIKQPTPHHRPPSSVPSSSTTGSRLATLKLQSVKSATVRKSTALNSKLPNVTATTTTTNNNNNHASKVAFEHDNLHKILDVTNLDSVTGDVGEIRRLLEQLLRLMQSDQDDTLEEENERLRKEVSELKDKIRAINSSHRCLHCLYPSS